MDAQPGDPQGRGPNRSSGAAAAKSAESPSVERAAGGRALELRGVSHGYREGLGFTVRPVLRSVNLVIEQGSITALLGPNGSGKSTLLRLAAGVETPRRGTVLAAGCAPTSARARAAVGYLPEGLPLPPELSCDQAVRLVARARGLARPADVARRWLERAGLSGAAARRRLPDLSSGMRRRLGLALTFLHAPDLVLLDEPSSGLDAEGLALLEALVDEASARGATIVLCSHRAGDLFHTAERALVLVEGRIALDGGLGELATDATRLEIELTAPAGADLAGALEVLRARGLKPGTPRPAAVELDALYRRLREDST